MRKTTFAAAAVALVMLYSSSTYCAEDNWKNFRQFLQSLRDMNSMVAATVDFVQTHGTTMLDTSVHISRGLSAQDYDEMAISLSSQNGKYDYILEIWTKRKSEWLKAMEFNFTDSTGGEFVWHPYALSTQYQRGTMDRLVCTSTNTGKSLEWDVEYCDNHPLALDRLKSTITSQNDTVTVYVAAHTDTNYSAIADTLNDAVLIGARITSASPNNAVMVFGLENIGSNYDNGFTIFSLPNPLNAGFFNSSGFVADSGTDGLHQGVSYPDPMSLTSSRLPSATEVAGVSVSFVYPGDTPAFVTD